MSTLVDVHQVMGTVVSIHAVVEDRVSPASLPEISTLAFEQAVADCRAELHEIDRIFSPYRDDSDISRLRRGAPGPVHPLVEEVHDLCKGAEEETGGLFSAWWRGWFDPTGYVKGWAVEAAHGRWLRPLLGVPGVIAVGVNAGGDMQLATAEGSDWQGRIGIADPLVRGELAAVVTVTDGAVATSGTSERGAHITDPRSGSPAFGTVSATVVADRLSTADMWATAVVAAGVDDLEWIRRAQHTSGLIIDSTGEARRWAHGRLVGSGARPSAGIVKTNAVPSGVSASMSTDPPHRDAISRTRYSPRP